ncbi:glycoside hydrolase family 72 protein [Babjeviella inositovora NRRL Y-12698]|uniref:1,3-beta-glucanosyltransferase n=1 Tax=Babjeviella inositovora NRRL Y-12698 TaxID=984486 RepID=A0A1E3QKY2_9ASCO|nr:glycoside hydrolase family 72 protein [Babjeviella inositovora NRRL Y-12698]ODQ78356.1 glycoside hydrolase family 72 protein [Babjeviella inositovora NRRL Y-12698]
MKFLSFSAGLLFSLAASAVALDAITIKGNAFWDGNTRFYVRGVDYQPSSYNGTKDLDLTADVIDPLANEETCKRDIAIFKDLGLNTIRVYTVDNTQNHTACMQMLHDAGIYLILDVNTPMSSISRSNPPCSYNSAYLENVFATMLEFADYDNTLAFFAGNEVINNSSNTDSATEVKAVVRDMKTFLKERNLRQVPVGYSAADVSSNRLEVAEYMNCGDDEMARSDFFGVNDYSWCGESSFTTSGYKQKVDLYANYGLPIILSEFGCNVFKGSATGTPRPFTEIGAIYSEQMSGVFSGGLVYQYTNETNNYGLVVINSSSNVTKMPDYYTLKSELAETQNPSGDGGYTSSTTISTCPAFEAGIWEASDDLPNTPDKALAFINKTAAITPGGLEDQTDYMCYADAADYKSGSSSASGGSSTTSRASSASSASSATSASSSSKAGAAGLAVGGNANVAVIIAGLLGVSVIVGAL